MIASCDYNNVYVSNNNSSGVTVTSDRSICMYLTLTITSESGRVLLLKEEPLPEQEQYRVIV